MFLDEYAALMVHHTSMQAARGTQIQFVLPPGTYRLRVYRSSEEEKIA